MATKKKSIKDSSVDLDIGGTFTDCYVSFDGGYAMGKSSTTRYDVSVGALRAMEEAAGSLQLTLEELLKDCSSVRYSTTISMNSPSPESRQLRLRCLMRLVAMNCVSTNSRR